MPVLSAQLTFVSASEDQTVALGVALGRVLRAGDVLALDGELGAGKTRLVRGLAEGLGVDPSMVASPTYVVVHEYRPMSPLTPVLMHVDAYRLSGPDDLDTLGWDRVNDGHNVVVAEWGSRILSALMGEPSLARVQILVAGEDRRVLHLVAPAAWTVRPEWNRLRLHADGQAQAQTGPASGWARCPTCGTGVPPDAPTFPFHDDRCRWADLGRWFSGNYTISRELEPDDEIDGPPA